MLASLSKAFKLARKIQIIQLAKQHSHNINEMSNCIKKGLPLHRVVGALQEYANVSLAESWDNVGLLIEPTESKEISHILVTNDLTEDVMQEAIELQVDMIISYHPPIFAPLKCITKTSWKQRIVAKCLENKIALYSPHTSFDSIQGGVNDWLVSAFDNIKECHPIEPSAGDNPENGMGRFCILNDKITIEEAVDLIKKHTGLNHVRLARKRGPNKPVSKIGVCAGAGTSVFKGLTADLYVTGEMQHHDILEAIHRGTNVILTNHSDSERGFLRNVFTDKLTSLLDNAVLVSFAERDEDPLKTV